jgi:putative endonuclease
MVGHARRAHATVEPLDRNEFAQALRSADGRPDRLRQFVTDGVSHATRSSLASSVVPTDLRQHLGRIGEDLALAHFERLGYDLVARNHRTRFGEIDLIVHDAATSTLVFCEVKTRRAGPGSPWDALGTAKREQVRRMALAYLAEVHHRPRAENLRFDAVGVVIDARGRLVRLDHLEGAF